MLGTLHSPQYQPRPYQEKWIRECLYSLKDFQSTMGQLPTGGGKTICFNEITRRCQLKNYRVLILAHREELIKQAQEKLFRHCGVRAGIIQGRTRSDYSLPVQVASVQTLKGRPKPPNIKLIITDEAHHAKAKSYKSIYEHYPDAYHLGVTATPIRANGEGFEDVYKDMITGPQIREMEDMGFLCPANMFHNPIHYSRLKSLDVSRGDYNEKQLSQLMNNEKRILDAVETWGAYARGQQTIAFAVDVAHSKRIVAAFKSKGVRAEHMDGKTPKDVRKRLIRDFSNRKIQYLSNVGIATEGTDIPVIECVQLLRPTMSLSLYLQMVGRGARLFPGKKNYTLLDHANSIWEHGYPNDDREWSLKGVEKKRKSKNPVQRQFKMILPDGRESIVTPQTIPEGLKGIRLVPLNSKDRSFLKMRKFTELLKLGQTKQYKPGWAFARFMEDQRTVPSIDELKHIGNLCKYKPGWAYRKHDELTKIFNNNGN